ncbi:MAG: 4Fe-4S binding protein, partial [Candidatus Aminicenantes bacterium]|nr:4Fe-4S binding protein [Candidatus Aminicenantes bacterium]
FDAEKCWGCGLCANTCPTEAISMQPLPSFRFPHRITYR